MPNLPKKKQTVQRWPLQFAVADGRSGRDFYVLASSNEYDEAFGATNAVTYQSPTSYFTHILHFTDYKRDRKYRLPDRLNDTWWSEKRQLMYAAGFPRGVFEIDSKNINEVILDDHDGAFFALWGVNDDHLFACGAKPFLLYRRSGVWQNIPLPPIQTEYLQDIRGTHEADIYIVGGSGTILHFDGKVVSILESPTTLQLMSIVPLTKEHFCIGGMKGLLLLGNRKGWRVAPTNVDDDLLSLAYFQGKVFYPTQKGLYAFDGKNPPALVLNMPLDWVSDLGDALFLRNRHDAWVYDGSQVIKLDMLL